VRVRRLAPVLVGLLAFALCAVLPAGAFGAAASRSASASPPAATATPSSLEVQLWPSELDGAVLVVGVELPAQTALPATVRVPVPAGANVTWVGQVFGGDPTADTEVPYTKEDGVGGPVIVATLTKSRSLQYEATLVSPTEAAGRYTSTLTWVQSAPAPQVGLSVKAAATAGDVRIAPGPSGAPQTNATGEQLYTLPPVPLALGKSVTVTASWVRVAPGSAAASGSSGSGSIVLYVLAGLLVAALLVLAVVLVRPRGRARE
jgi:hypothetical protein